MLAVKAFNFNYVAARTTVSYAFVPLKIYEEREKWKGHIMVPELQNNKKNVFKKFIIIKKRKRIRNTQ